MERNLERPSALAVNEGTRRSISPTERTFDRRALLPLKKDSLWQITSGIVRTVTWLEDGTTVALGIWESGDIVGRIFSTANPYHIECLTIVEVRELPAQIWPSLTEAMISHIQRSGEFLEIARAKSAEVSLLRLLTWLAKRFGRTADKGYSIDLRLTHQDLADFIGTSRVTVTRVLKEFEQQGIIHRLKRHVIVLQAPDQFWHYEI